MGEIDRPRLLLIGGTAGVQTCGLSVIAQRRNWPRVITFLAIFGNINAVIMIATRFWPSET